MRARLSAAMLPAVLCGALLASRPSVAQGAAEAAQAPDPVAQEVARLRTGALDLYLGRTRRLLALHEPIRLAAAELCGPKLSPVLGVVAWTGEELPRSLRDAARDELRVDDAGVRVVYVLPGFPAERAGLRAGDRVLSVDGRKLRRGRRLEARHPGRLGATLRLEVEREAQVVELSVPVRLGCFSPARVALDDAANAFMEQGGHMWVTSGLLRTHADDDEIAVILGHEVAHYVLGSGGRPVYEADADYLGLYVAARAGRDVNVAPGLWARWSRETPAMLENDKRRSHPGGPERMLTLQAAAAEIEAKRANGEPLVPEPPR